MEPERFIMIHPVLIELKQKVDQAAICLETEKVDLQVALFMDVHIEEKLCDIAEALVYNYKDRDEKKLYELLSKERFLKEKRASNAEHICARLIMINRLSVALDKAKDDLIEYTTHILAAELRGV